MKFFPTNYENLCRRSEMFSSQSPKKNSESCFFVKFSVFPQNIKWTRGTQFSETCRKKKFETLELFWWKSKNKILFWYWTILPQENPLETQEVFLNTLTQNSGQKPQLSGSKSKKNWNWIFFGEKITSRFSSGHLKWSFDSTAKSFSAKVPELFDKITKVSTAFFRKNIHPQKLAWKTSKPLWQHCWTFSRRKPEIILLMSYNFIESESFPKKFFSEIGPGQVKYSFLNPD